MYPVYVYENGLELPKTGGFYVVAGNGCFFHKDTPVLKGFFPVPAVGCLDDFDVGPVQFVLPAIPHELVMKIKRFFVEVFQKYHSEAVVVLYFDPEDNKYTIHAPRQWNTHSSVKYIRPTSSSLGLVVGTIHSHCDFKAFHSGVDQYDEEYFEGLHITFGDITDASGMSIVASLVVNQFRIPLDPMTCLQNITPTENRRGKMCYKILQPEGNADYTAWEAEVATWVTKVNEGSPPQPWDHETITAWREAN